MGASESKLSLGYTLKENVSENAFFSLFAATDKATDKSVSVFLGKPGILTDPSNFKLLQHAVQVGFE
jgi:hypothetical protein